MERLSWRARQLVILYYCKEDDSCDTPLLESYWFAQAGLGWPFYERTLRDILVDKMFGYSKHNRVGYFSERFEVLSRPWSDWHEECKVYSWVPYVDFSYLPKMNQVSENRDLFHNYHLNRITAQVVFGMVGTTTFKIQHLRRRVWFDDTNRYGEHSETKEYKTLHEYYQGLVSLITDCILVV